MTDPLHRAARVEDRIGAIVERFLRRRGWEPRVLGFTGYGTAGRFRVLARVLLAPPRTTTGELQLGRGWRRFFTAPVAGVPVTVELGGSRRVVTSSRGGYIDTVVSADLEPGWADVRLSLDDTAPTRARVRVVADRGGLGVLSDIDDTVIVTALPRPLVAAWNSFVRHERSRRPVTGMATLYREIERRHPDAPFVYLSTGAWNVAPVLAAFLARHGYPPGPLLMTDWGPTTDAFFRSGRAHKRSEIARLFEDLPQVQWLLVGDDGQHDPQIYAEAARHRADRVAAIAIRQLSTAEQVRTHGTPDPLPGEEAPTVPGHVEVRAPDGFGLLAALRDRGVLSG